MRRALRIAAIAIAAALPSGTAAAKPQRILSMNQCTDLLVLQLVPKIRVAGVTYLARQGARSLFPGAADGIAVNYGTPEDIIKFRPDLILTGDFSLAVTRRLAHEVGAPLVEVKSARTFDDVRAVLRQIGEAVGEPARAQALIARMDVQLAALAAHRPTRPNRIVAWDGGATVPGTETLANQIIQAAGAVNIAARPGVIYTSFGVEELLQSRPEALLYGGGDRPLVQNEESRHRAIRQMFAGRRISYVDVAYSCGLPQSAQAAVDLRRALDALPPAGSRP
ncbi:MAG: ABC transporter substrate-binding protein [Alphaproteobacteria bacterium]|nr:ABC transporter substrate-binding protein [Alphaproteobacteria bacterium]MBU1516417.1 ABC transporter substrate-binding protein [Alphaproteobacteria bacterium]MBU2093346.1 ABC transporter substrate-binding protein [Alphaproteobacteria bacterium]MBU2153833.1 ABC transporter substrate-binding protein [Alphaproteobacteria bacterium]MBU2307705.1 ABC transporter substrate-binding protein [Alphaproteobacteria bacterium]